MTLAAFSKKTNGRCSLLDSTLTSKLFSFSQGWGAKEECIGLIACSAEGGCDPVAHELGSTLHFQFYQMDDTSKETGNAEQQSRGLRIIHLPNISSYRDTDLELLNKLVTEYKVSPNLRFSLLTRLRFARAFDSLPTRQQHVCIRLHAFIVFVQAGGDTDGLASFFVNQPEFVNELVSLLSYEDAIPEKIRTLGILSLLALCQDQSRRSMVLNSLMCNGQLGILPNLLQKTMDSIVRDYSSQAIIFPETLISLVNGLVSSSSGHRAMQDVGVIPILLPLLKDTNPQHLHLVSNAVHILKALNVYTNPAAAGGLDDTIARLKFEVSYVDNGLKKHEEESHYNKKGKQGLNSASELDVCPLYSEALVTYNRRSLMKALLSAISLGIYTPGNSGRIYGSVENLLPHCLCTIFRRAKELGGGVFSLAAIVMSDLIHKYPTCFPVLEAADLPRAFLDSVMGGVLYSAKVVTQIPLCLEALCLNLTGLQAVKERNALGCFVKIFTTRTYLQALSSDTLRSLSTNLDALMRHQSSLRGPGVDMLIEILNTILKIGSEEEPYLSSIESSNSSAPIPMESDQEEGSLVSQDEGKSSRLESLEQSLEASSDDFSINVESFIRECISNAAHLLEVVLQNAETCSLFIEKKGVEAVLQLFSLPLMPLWVSIGQNVSVAFKKFSPQHSVRLARVVCTFLREHLRLVNDLLESVSGIQLAELEGAKQTKVLRSLSSLEGLLLLSNFLLKGTSMISELGSTDADVLNDLGRAYKAVLWQITLICDSKADEKRDAEQAVVIPGSTVANAAGRERCTDADILPFIRYMNPVSVRHVSAPHWSEVTEQEFLTVIGSGDGIHRHGRQGLSWTRDGRISQQLDSIIDLESSSNALEDSSVQNVIKKSPDVIVLQVLNKLAVAVRSLHNSLAIGLMGPHHRADSALTSRSLAVALAKIFHEALSYSGHSTAGLEVKHSVKCRYLGKVVNDMASLVINKRGGSCNTVLMNSFYVHGTFKELLVTFEATCQLLWTPSYSISKPDADQDDVKPNHKAITGSTGQHLTGPPLDEGAIAMVMEVGFTRARAEEAFRHVGSNSTELATNWLFCHPEECLDENEDITKAIALSLENSSEKAPPVDDILAASMNEDCGTREIAAENGIVYAALNTLSNLSVRMNIREKVPVSKCISALLLILDNMSQGEATVPSESTEGVCLGSTDNASARDSLRSTESDVDNKSPSDAQHKEFCNALEKILVKSTGHLSLEESHRTVAVACDLIKNMFQQWSCRLFYNYEECDSSSTLMEVAESSIKDKGKSKIDDLKKANFKSPSEKSEDLAKVTFILKLMSDIILMYVHATEVVLKRDSETHQLRILNQADGLGNGGILHHILHHLLPTSSDKTSDVTDEWKEKLSEKASWFLVVLCVCSSEGSRRVINEIVKALPCFSNLDNNSSKNVVLPNKRVLIFTELVNSILSKSASARNLPSARCSSDVAKSMIDGGMVQSLTNMLKLMDLDHPEAPEFVDLILKALVSLTGAANASEQLVKLDGPIKKKSSGTNERNGEQTNSVSDGEVPEDGQGVSNESGVVPSDDIDYDEEMGGNVQDEEDEDVAGGGADFISLADLDYNDGLVNDEEEDFHQNHVTGGFARFHQDLLHVMGRPGDANGLINIAAEPLQGVNVRGSLTVERQRHGRTSHDRAGLQGSAFQHPLLLRPSQSGDQNMSSSGNSSRDSEALSVGFDLVHFYMLDSPGWSENSAIVFGNRWVDASMSSYGRWTDDGQSSQAAGIAQAVEEQFIFQLRSMVPINNPSCDGHPENTVRNEMENLDAPTLICEFPAVVMNNLVIPLSDNQPQEGLRISSALEEESDCIKVDVNVNNETSSSSAIDPTFLEVLPENLRAEVLASQQQQPVQAGTYSLPSAEDIDPVFLSALPPNIQEELLAQQQTQRISQSQQARGQPVGMYSASVLDTSYPDLHEDVLFTSSEAFLSALPLPMLSEAQMVRESQRNDIAIGNQAVMDTGIGVPIDRRPVSIPENGLMVKEIKRISLLDPSALKALLRLLRLAQLSAKGYLQKLLLNLCEHSGTRAILVSLLLDMIKLEAEGCAAGTLAHTSQRLYGCLPPLVSRRVLEVLTYLATEHLSFANILFDFDFSLVSESASATGPETNKIDRGKTAEGTGFNAHLEQVMVLIQVVFKKAVSKIDFEPLTESLQNAGRIQAQSVNGEQLASQKELSISEQNCDEKKESCSTEASSSGGKKNVNQYDIFLQLPNSELRNLCNILAHESLSEKVYSLAAELVKKMASVAASLRNFFISVLADLTPNLSASVVGKLVTLRSRCMLGLSADSMAEAAIIRVLQALHTLTSAVDGIKRQEIESEQANQTIMWKLNGALEPLWQELSECITMLENELVKNSTFSYSISEAFFLLSEKLQANHYNPQIDNNVTAREVKEYDGSSSASPVKSSGLVQKRLDGTMTFIRFADKHRLLLNAFIRQNSGLLEKSFSIMLKAPNLIDFDNKRTYFRSRIRQQNEQNPSDSLWINVRRAYVLEDSYRQLHARSSQDLRGELTVQFQGEEGYDAGGLTREWYQLLSRVIFDKGTLLFTSVGNHMTFQPNPNSVYQNEHLSYFKFVGRVVAKALSDGQLLDVYFSRSFYKHILGLKVTYHDMKDVDREYYKSLEWMLEVKDFELIPGGRNIMVTEETKHEYINLVAEYVLTKSIHCQIHSFLEGFNELVPRDLISIFDEEELKLLISGLPVINLDDLQANTGYTGYTAASSVVQWFWEVVKAFNKEDRARLLQFTTGTSKVPLEGFKALQGASGPQIFQIHKAYGSPERLPSANTCSNQLNLPEYTTKEQLEDRLLLAIHEVDDLPANTVYTGYTAASSVVQWFWEVVKAFNKEDRARLLQYATGTSKVPLEGFKALQGASGPQIFQIHKAYGSPE
ncbi:E3 ubiquitin-protein ligase UPL1 [Acorus calamus]|uniref:HECT-type E3 ubiquitin transferase n=1 Tax=Acorus calamus TaxID=4465 RepID=A0AAV9ERZ2_ACOCL|nr:E3 ubiquitin-protein ligase UPL1 [Acorus calamus]